MFDFAGKKVLVTGSTQGIGRAVAAAFAQNGATVFVHGTGKEKTERAAKEIGLAATKFSPETMEFRPEVQAVYADLSEPHCAESLYRQTGNVDILVSNVSIQFRRSWDEITEEEFEKQIRVNLLSALKLIQIYVPYMKQQKWGRIITVGSVQQAVPHKDMLVYAASKEAQYSMVRNLAKQLAPDGITVNNVAPGVIITPRNDEALSDAVYAKQVLSGIPMGYAGEPEDCAGAVLMLAGEAGRYITGVNLMIDGGMSL